MGIYVYMIRGPKKCVTVEIEKHDKTTEIKEIAQFAYLHKPFWGYGEKWNRPYEMAIARMEKLWDRSGKPIPDTFTVIHEKIKAGNSVYRVTDGRTFTWCYDTPSFGDNTERIGVVKRIL